MKTTRTQEALEIVETLLDEAKHGPTMKALKKGKVKLKPEERKKVVDAGAVWPWDKSPGVWKSVVNGKTWYCCNTHRAGVCKPTLKGAIAAFKWVETTA